ncbi:MAG: hypothetical protein LBB44_06140 [Endomicrobium sp.]|jgi:hypothetical protein|nr:hypothetical protein [Endomicrobium sp.]
MIKNKKILDYIIIIKMFLLFFWLAFPVIAVAEGYRGDISLSNGGQLNQSTNYQHISSVNNGITFAEVPLMTFDNMISMGAITSFWLNNGNISYENMTLENKPLFSGSTVPTNTVNIGITFKTANGDIRQIKYGVSQDSDNITDYIVVYSSWDPGVPVGPSIQISTTTDKLEKGINYIQWYAQNTADVEGILTGIFIIYVTDSDEYIKILQPGQIASLKPKIKAELYSAYGFNESSVTVKLFSGSSTNTASIYIATGVGRFKYENGKKFLDYTYDGMMSLVDKGPYTLSVEFTDNKNKTVGPKCVTFRVNSEQVAQLLPYPSPYNPNSGKPMKIKYVLAEAASVTINIYDRAGKFISKVIEKISSVEGANYADWDAKSYAGDSLANGIYICEIITDSGKENRRYRSFAILRK